jgi:hypothetical protein
MIPRDGVDGRRRRDRTERFRRSARLQVKLRVGTGQVALRTAFRQVLSDGD